MIRYMFISEWLKTGFIQAETNRIQSHSDICLYFNDKYKDPIKSYVRTLDTKEHNIQLKIYIFIILNGAPV